MKKNTLIVTGGAGFVGSNLISLLLKKTNFKIISLDNYSSGYRKNHINNNRVKYIKGNTKDIFKSSETEKTANSNSEIKSKIALPTAGGFAYSKNRNEKEKKEQDVSKSSKKVK